MPKLKYTSPGVGFLDTRYLKITDASSTYQTLLVNSAGLLAALDDETGTGLAVFNDTPTLVTPVLGVASATSIDFGASLLATRSLTVDTGGVFNIVLASAAGDDFTVDTDKLVVEGDTGNVGIGTTNPGGLLDVNGRIGATSIKFASTFGDLTNNSPWYGIGAANYALPGGLANYTVQVGGYYGISLQTQSGQLVVTTAGNVGIGTTNPATFKLQVAGNVGPQTDSAYDLGSNSVRWANIYADNIYGGSSGTLGYWQRNSTNLSPATITDNVGIGTTGPSGKLTVEKDNTGTSLATLTNAHLVLNNPNASGQTMFTFAIDGVAKGGVRGDYPGNFNWHASGSQGHQFYGSVDNATPILGMSGSGLSILRGAGQVARKALDVQGDAIISGNVGIGTTGPGGILHLKSDTSSSVGQLILQTSTLETATSGHQIQFTVPNGTTVGRIEGVHAGVNNFFMAFHTWGGPGANQLRERVRINNSGNVGIGETSPDSKLEVNGDLHVKDKIAFTQDDKNEYIDSLNDGYMDYRATTAHRFGDGTNQLLISNAGVVTLEGTAKRWLAVRPDLDFTTITAQGKPAQVVVGVFHGYSMPIYNSDNQELFFNLNVPGRWDEASNIVVHVVVAISDAEDIGDYLKFQLSWEHLSEEDAIPTTSHDVEVEQAILSGRTAQYSTYELIFTLDYDIDDPDDVADHDDIAMRLRRIDATNPDVSNNVIVLDYHVEFQVDKMFDAEAE